MWCFDKNCYKREKYILLLLKKRTKEKTTIYHKHPFNPFIHKFLGRKRLLIILPTKNLFMM